MPGEGRASEVGRADWSRMASSRGHRQALEEARMLPEHLQKDAQLPPRDPRRPASALQENKHQFVPWDLVYGGPGKLLQGHCHPACL